MSSTIRGEDDFDTKDIVVGTAKAWVNFDGTGTVAIRDSFNVSSITDNTTGNYTVNLTNNMLNADYSVSVSCCGGGADTNRRAAVGFASEPPVVGSFVVRTASGDTAVLNDVPYIYAQVFGELA